MRGRVAEGLADAEKDGWRVATFHLLFISFHFVFLSFLHFLLSRKLLASLVSIYTDRGRIGDR